MQHNQNFGVYRSGWRTGSVHAGHLKYDERFDGFWTIDSPSILEVSVDGQTIALPQLSGAKKFAGRSALVYRANRVSPPSVFIDLPKYYVAATDLAGTCRELIAKRHCVLDRTKTVICKFSYGQWAALRVGRHKRQGQECIGAVYQLYAQSGGYPCGEKLSRTDEERLRDTIERQQGTTEKFLANPFDPVWGPPRFLIWKIGYHTMHRPGDCGFDGLLPVITPTAAALSR